MQVDFFFGPGSRYSYLATAQLGGIAMETGAVIRWRPVCSADLIARAGFAPFAGPQSSGQYNPAYRTRDVARWADWLELPFVEFDMKSVDWRLVAHWCAAAMLLGEGERFALRAFHASFGLGQPPRQEAELAMMALMVGMAPEPFQAEIASGAATALLDENLEAALAVGAFGVPSFVTEGGSLFFGQDRIPLLVHHLRDGGGSAHS